MSCSHSENCFWSTWYYGSFQEKKKKGSRERNSRQQGNQEEAWYAVKYQAELKKRTHPKSNNGELWTP